MSGRRSLALAAIALLFAIGPLRELVAGASARACAPASCCMAKGHACPMHQRDGCRMKSCGERDVALVQVPPAVAPLATAHASPLVPAAAATSPDVVLVDRIVPPPEPPPPRRLV
jgi:hypothetical protein